MTDVYKKLQGNMPATGVKPSSMAGSNLTTAQDVINSTQASGYFDGGEITDAGGGEIDVAAGNGFVKTTDNPIGSTLLFSWAASSGISLTNLSTNYVYVDYNSGTPVVGVETTKSADGRTKFYLGKVFREGTDLHVLQAGQSVEESLKAIQSRVNAAFGEIQRTSGMELSEAGTRNIATTGGVYYGGFTRRTTVAIDTSGSDTFEYYRLISGAWTETDETQIDNLQYNDVSSPGSEVLATLSNNKYGAHYVFADIDGHLMVVYGQGNYDKLADAQAAPVPSVSFGHVADFGMLVGRIIIQKSASVFAAVESAFDIKFNASLVTAHNETTGLQGGIADEYYHLTGSQHTAVDHAIHDNEASEISAVTEKTVPVGNDLLLIEDSEATNAKKRLKLSNLPGGVDTTAIHKATAAEISAMTEKSSPVPDDVFVIEDSEASYAKKKVLVSNLPGGVDTTAIHKAVDAEISAMTEKRSPVFPDLLVIEDSASSDAKKKILMSALQELMFDEYPHYCIIHPTSTVSVPDDTLTYLPGPAIINAHGMWSYANPTYLTIQRSGWYALAASVEYRPDADGVRRLEFIRDGDTSSPLAVDRMSGATASVNAAMNTSRVIYLTAGERVECGMYHTAGNAVLVEIQNRWLPHFSVCEIRNIDGYACEVYRGTDQAIPTATPTMISFSGSSIDARSMHDNGTYPTRVTIQRSGTYLVWGGIRWEANASSQRMTRLKLNGTTYIAKKRFGTVASGTINQTVTAGRYFTAGDYIELEVEQNSGGNLNVEFQNYSSPFLSVVEVESLQPAVTSIRKSSDTVIPNNALYTLPSFNTVIKDTTAGFGTEDPTRISIKNPGVYWVTASMEWEAHNTGFRYSKIVTPEDDCMRLIWATVGSGTIAQNQAGALPFHGNESIGLQVGQTSGGNLNLTAIDESSPRLSAIRLGPCHKRIDYYRYKFHQLDSGVSSTNSSSPVEKMSLICRNCLAGTHILTVYFTWRYTNTTDDFRMQITVNNGSAIATGRTEIIDSGSDQVCQWHISTPIELAAGYNYIDLDYYAVNATSYIWNVFMQLEKVDHYSPDANR